jgi:Xaa-Pro aminopeptidase
MSPAAPVGPPEPIPAERFRERRTRALEVLGGGVLVLPGSPVRHRSRDTEFPHRPDSELYYLTGLVEPDTVAVLRGGQGGGLTVFARPRDPEAELWAGPRLGPDGARERTGADAAHALGELPARLPDLLDGATQVYFRLGEHPAVEPYVLAALRRARVRGPRRGTGPRRVGDPGLVLDDIRLRKDADELERMRRAAAITATGFEALAEAIRPGAGEWQLQAALEAAFRSAGGDGPAYESIVASGPNACVLHYVSRERRLGAGELVLVDAGAAYGLYAADITRTYPVGGDFGAEARAVYEIVEGARRAAVASVAPGATVASVHDAAVRALTEGLIGLGVLTGPLERALEDEAHKPFYPHQTSHWLGLDVHDVGDYALAGESRALEAGMVLTVEPGLYFGTAAQVAADEADKAAEGSTREAVARFAGIGVRIEDDVLVTPDGHEVLTAAVPTAPDEVARLIQA